MRIIIGFFIFIAILGCTNLDKNTRHYQAYKNNGEITLQQLVDDKNSFNKYAPTDMAMQQEGKNFALMVHQKGLMRATKEMCAIDPQKSFCKVFSKPTVTRLLQSPAQGLGIGSTKAKKLLRAKNFSQLAGATVNDIIYGSKMLLAKDLNSVAKALNENKSCHRSEVYVGVAATLELNFPDENNLSEAKSLLLKASQCGADDLSKFASYRLGVFNVWGGDCKSAEPLLNASLSHSQNYYQSRAIYWQNLCKSKSAKNSTREPASFYSKYPLSLYPLLEVEGERFDAYKVVAQNDEPRIYFRSKNNEYLNQSLELAEIFINIGELNLVEKIFDRIDLRDIQNEPIELQFYISYQLWLAESDLFKFQILSKLFSKNPAYKTISTMRLYYPKRYIDEVKKVGSQIDPLLILALIRQESAFNKMARSQKSAMGLMQLIPAMARTYGYRPKDMFDSSKNISAGVKFLNHLVRRYNGHVHLALAAYNAGPRMVDSWVKRYPTDNPILFMDLIPFRETREYVAAILRNWYWYSNLYPEEATSNTAGRLVYMERGFK